MWVLVVNFERKVWASPFSRISMSFSSPYLGNPCEYSHNLTFLETRIIDLHFAADRMVISSFKFFWWASWNDFLQEYVSAVQGHPGHWFWYQSKGRMRVALCDYLLVRHSNFGPILHSFGNITGFCAHDPTPIPQYFEVFPLHQIAHVGVNVSCYRKLFGREIIFEVFQPIWSRYLNVTDRWTTYCGTTALEAIFIMRCAI